MRPLLHDPSLRDPSPHLTTAPGRAARLRAPSWRDPRLVVGLLLVLVSVLVGARVVAAADASTPAWVAAHVLVPGDEITPDDLRAVDLHLDGSGESYLAATQAPPAGAVVLRQVGAGELVPRSALGSAADLAVRPVGLPVTGPLPSGLVAGALVDVWITVPETAASRAAARSALVVPAPDATTDPLTGSGTGSGTGSADGPGAGTAGTAAVPDGAPSGAVATGPQQLASAAVVTEVVSDAGSFTAGRGAVVQVALDPEQLRLALQALAADAEVSLVLVPGSSPTPAAG